MLWGRSKLKKKQIMAKLNFFCRGILLITEKKGVNSHLAFI